MPAFAIAPARTPADLDAARAMFVAYAEAIGIDLSYQGFEAELAGLPGKYAPPEGELLLARGGDGGVLGCVAVRPLAAGACEMKRLYVDPAARGLGLGKALVAAVLAEAERIGHREMKLDTLPSMTAAIALYEAAGFRPVAAYYETPLGETLFFGRRIGP